MPLLRWLARVPSMTYVHPPFRSSCCLSVRPPGRVPPLPLFALSLHLHLPQQHRHLSSHLARGLQGTGHPTSSFFPSPSLPTSTTSSATTSPLVPLRERPPLYLAPLGTLQKVYEHMRRLAETHPHGDDPDELQRALRYLWEDAVDGIAILSPSTSSDTTKTKTETETETETETQTQTKTETDRDIPPTRSHDDSNSPSPSSSTPADLIFSPTPWSTLEPLLSGRDTPRDGTLRISFHEVRLRARPEDLRALWERRVLGREPIQYLTASADWRDMVLAVGPGVLIPRPETEFMVDIVTEHLISLSQQANTVRDHPNLPWVDLGTGSGALAVALARLPEAIRPSRVYATDLSPVALAVAATNVARYRCEDIVHLRQGSWWEALEVGGGVGTDGGDDDDDGLLRPPAFGGVVANPPYIPPALLSSLEPEVRDHEPTSALIGGGADGAGDCRAIMAGARRWLVGGGMLLLECHGGEQAAQLVAELRRKGTGFEHVTGVEDLRGVTRYVRAMRVLRD